jgi:hypothetical protein
MADPTPPTTKQSPPPNQGKAEAPKEAPKVKTEAERRGEIAAEYEVLLSQSQDEHSIIKALCSRYSLDEATLGEIVTQSRKASADPTKRDRAAMGVSQPAHEGQMGTAPPKGTVQSGKAPESDK